MAKAKWDPTFIIKHGPNDRETRVCFNPTLVASVTESTKPTQVSITLASGEVVEVVENFDSAIKKLFNLPV